jgi:hypothetical protein
MGTCHPLHAGTEAAVPEQLKDLALIAEFEEVFLLSPHALILNFLLQGFLHPSTSHRAPPICFWEAAGATMHSEET